VPGLYEDFRACPDLVVLSCSNLAWCQSRAVPAARKPPSARGLAMKIVVIDPRSKRETCDISDLHLALEAGSDVVLF
jgi:assimilatory nitrate reductase catalytic subunit